MALVTVQRSPSVSSSPPSSEYGSSAHSSEEEEHKHNNLSEYYFAVKGFAALLPKNECQLGRGRRTSTAPAVLQGHLQAMLHLLCPGDTLHMAVRLESLHFGRVRYLAVVGRIGRQDQEEDCLLGVDFNREKPSAGLVVPVLADTRITLDGDGGFNVSTGGRKHIFKPISVQAMWSALQTLHKSSARAQSAHYFLGGLNHDWVGYYERSVSSDQSCINEWNAMDSLESKRPPSPDSFGNKEETEDLIRVKLKAIMMSVDIDEVTSKYIRQRLEEELTMDLFKYKSYIDQEMLVILGQMDAATEIFPHVYLGSEWNASNLEELQNNKIGYILNVTKEIDNFYPGTFDYLNIRVYDDEKTELLKHWDSTYRYIAQVKEKGSKVLVHCKMGISRSASVVIAYAMKAFNMSLEEAFKVVKKKRSCIKPNQAFRSQLKTYEGILDASRQRHNILWRSKSETNLKSAAAMARSVLRNNPTRNLRDNVDSSNKNTKSIEELAKYNSSYDTLSVNVPIACDLLIVGTHNRRPKSWSPDDHIAELLFPHDVEQGGNDFGESWRLSQSLNVQSWRAHVTLQQRDIRDMPVDGQSSCESPAINVVEAFNPLYSDIPVGNTIDEESVLQLSSSVKERINEFENVQTNNSQSGVSTIKSVSSKKGNNITGSDNSTISSDDFSNLSNTAELDKVIETLLSPGEVLEGSAPVLSQTKPAAPKHQAILVPSQIWPEEKCEVEEQIETADSVINVPKDSVVMPSGIVKKQKQDIEEKVKSSDIKSNNCVGIEGGETLLSRQNSSGSLSGHFKSKVEVVRSPSYVRQESEGSDGGIKKDDPFSTKLDKVFDREERKQQRLSAVNPQLGDVKDTPSRNNSWGSFDSAVILADREFPSRQSSWGSCDTRGTAGTVASRNSSFGPIDNKQQLVKVATDEINLKSNLSGTYFEKETGPYSPGTIRRNKLKISDTKDDLGENLKCETSEMDVHEEILSEDSSVSKAPTNVKAYGPAPYKSPVERVAPMELSGDGIIESSEKCLKYNMDNSPINLPVSVCSNTTTPPNVSSCTIELKLQTPDVKEAICNLSCSDETNCAKENPLLESEVLTSGMVKKHKHFLEGKTQDNSNFEFHKVNEKLPSPTFVRSKSYCDPGTERYIYVKDSLGRSFSEKKAKFEVSFDRDSENGKVKQLTQALEKQKKDKKIMPLKMKGFRKRSHSLERLSTSPTSPNSSSKLLDELLDQTEKNVRNLENEASMEEICVKSLVGKFEDSKEKGENGVSSSKNQVRNVRAKSDSSTPDNNKVLPPVPQRKSSLDYNFKPTLRALSQPPPVSVRHSIGATCNISSQEKTPSPSASPSVSGSTPFHKPPPGSGRGQNCGIEVRQKKQQGKTHPLTKLTKANRENYHTV